MHRFINYLERNPTISEIEDRIVQLEQSFAFEKTITAQIANQDERQLLEAVVKWARKL